MKEQTHAQAQAQCSWQIQPGWQKSEEAHEKAQ